MTVRHDGFAGLRKPADEHAAGWERFLGWLTSYLEVDQGVDNCWTETPTQLSA